MKRYKIIGIIGLVFFIVSIYTIPAFAFLGFKSREEKETIQRTIKNLNKYDKMAYQIAKDIVNTPTAISSHGSCYYPTKKVAAAQAVSIVYSGDNYCIIRLDKIKLIESLL